ncbi:uncharacterized protein LOC130541532 isoform X1 [Pan paniscus]|uniref:uncharacterized protein LOC130541532 isoform X1 n=1 Tax=Pan paniscus TaxID=9597 RepID=UPI0025464483|nr:uncharacterized protein LOC130541532 isoform X1 [Pan paniscus]
MATEWSTGNRICAAPWPKEAAEPACVPRPPSRAVHALMASAARRSSGRHTSRPTTPGAAQRRCVLAALRGFRRGPAGLGQETRVPAGSELGDATAVISHRGGVGKRGSLRLQGLGTASGQPQQRPPVSAGQRARPVPRPPSSPAGPGPEGPEGAGCVLRLSAISAGPELRPDHFLLEKSDICIDEKKKLFLAKNINQPHLQSDPPNSGRIAVNDSSCFSTSLSAFGAVSVLDFDHCNSHPP